MKVKKCMICLPPSFCQVCAGWIVAAGGQNCRRASRRCSGPRNFWGCQDMRGWKSTVVGPMFCRFWNLSLLFRILIIKGWHYETFCVWKTLENFKEKTVIAILKNMEAWWEFWISKRCGWTFLTLYIGRLLYVYSMDTACTGTCLFPHSM